MLLAKIDAMKIVINGQEQNFAPTTLALLIEQLGMKQDRVAVELNRDIVPRTKWAETNLPKATAWKSSTSSAAGLVAPAFLRLCSGQARRLS